MSRQTVEYVAWYNMIDRCHSSNHPAYERYGGRGITVCDEWRDPKTGFPSFLAEVGPRPGKEFSIDRIENNKGYEPGNCRWATRKEQSRNRRSNKLLTIDGVTKTMVEWADEAKVSYRIIKERIKAGW